MDDALRHTGGARGEQHPERVVEGHVLVVWLDGVAEQRTEVQPSRACTFGDGGVVCPVGVAHQDGVRQGRQAGLDLGEVLDAIDAVAVELVAIHANENGGFELTQPLECRVRRQVRRIDAPDCSDTGRREQANNGLRDIRKDRRDAVARFDAEPPQPPGERSDPVSEFTPGQLGGGVVLADAEYGRRVAQPTSIGVAQNILGKVQPRARVPERPRHPFFAQRRSVETFAQHVEVLAYRFPETREIVDRPAPELAVVGQVHAAGRFDPAHEVPDSTLLTLFARRLPRHLSGIGGCAWTRHRCPFRCGIRRRGVGRVRRHGVRRTRKPARGVRRIRSCCRVLHRASGSSARLRRLPPSWCRS